MEQFSNDEENIIQLKQRRYFNSSFVKNLSNGYTLRICTTYLISASSDILVDCTGVPTQQREGELHSFIASIQAFCFIINAHSLDTLLNVVFHQYFLS
jgi:hypothetical protein